MVRNLTFQRSRAERSWRSGGGYATCKRLSFGKNKELSSRRSLKGQLSLVNRLAHSRKAGHGPRCEQRVPVTVQYREY